jgi:DNA-directed RNA polymerase subunit L
MKIKQYKIKRFNYKHYNMPSKFNINISEIEYHKTKDLEYSKLILKFDGTDVNEIILNTLRRVLLNDVPTYAFAPECILIEKNTSVFNNDQMKVRLMQLPIMNMKLNVPFLDDKYWFNVNYTNLERERHPLEKIVEIYINSKNLDESIKNVTTNDIEYYVENERVNHNYNEKYPIVLIKLRPTEIFQCRMKAVLGVGERHVIWSGTSNAYFNKMDDHSIFHIESHGQFSEYELLWKACQYVQLKMEQMKTKIVGIHKMSSNRSDLKTVELVMDGESHTIGNLLTYYIQNLDIVEYAGVGKKNELVRQITIKVVYKKNVKEPLEPIFEAIEQCVNLMKQLENTIYTLGKKHITNYSK